MRALEDRIRADGLDKHRSDIEEVVRGVQTTYGERSAEYAQARNEAALLVYEAASARESIAYFRQSLEADLLVYGHDHRETAFAINDYGRIQMLAATDHYQPAALRWLREVLDVRRRVLGDGHIKTAASERFVAEQLLTECDHERPCTAGDAKLAERPIAYSRDSPRRRNATWPMRASSSVESGRCRGYPPTSATVCAWTLRPQCRRRDG